MYKFKVRAVNRLGIDKNGDEQMGYSAFSDVVEVALVNPPSSPASPTKVSHLSNSTKITVRWEQNSVPLEELPYGEVKSYKLYRDDGQLGDYQLVSHTAASLT